MFGVACIFLFFVTFACIARANGKISELEAKLAKAENAIEV